jgi:hypothetical protein
VGPEQVLGVLIGSLGLAALLGVCLLVGFDDATMMMLMLGKWVDAAAAATAVEGSDVGMFNWRDVGCSAMARLSLPCVIFKFIDA